MLSCRSTNDSFGRGCRWARGDNVDVEGLAVRAEFCHADFEAFGAGRLASLSASVGSLRLEERGGGNEATIMS